MSDFAINEDQPLDLSLKKPMVTSNSTTDVQSLKIASTLASSVSSIKRYSCQYCPGTFSLATNLRKHERNLHADLLATRPDRDESLFCNGCKSQFLTQRSLNYHLSQSRTCQSALMRRSSMASSNEIQPNEETKSETAPEIEQDGCQCKYCPAWFRWSSKLRKHERLCHPEMLTNLPFQCQGCWKRFNNRKAITQHLRWSLRCQPWKKFCLEQQQTEASSTTPGPILPLALFSVTKPEPIQSPTALLPQFRLLISTAEAAQLLTPTSGSGLPNEMNTE